MLYFYQMYQVIAKGCGLGLLLALAIGPVIFTVINQSINHGKRGGFAFVAGVWVSDILWVILSNSFGGLINNILKYKAPIAIAGGLFLFAMGVNALFLKKYQTAPQQIDINDEVVVGGKPKVKYFSIFTAGVTLNTLNPSVLAFWLFVTVSVASIYDSFVERFILFGACLAVNMLADVVKVFGAGTLGKTLSFKNIVRINKISGLLYILFGVIIIAGIFISSK
jgi:threonine/homoserine/homoserine lactone efflux protein